jgi:DNA-directed RNA polymerase subunit M
MRFEKAKGNFCSCGYSDNSKDSGIITEKIISKKSVAVEIEEKIETLPLTDEVPCPKCEHKGAYWWTKQTRASDEPETQFFRCAKCNHTWRDYR